MFTPVQKDMLVTGLKWLVAALLTAFLILMMLFYREEAKDAQDKLQDVTQQLIEARGQHESFVVEQELLQSIMAYGKVAKDASKVKTDEAIKEHRSKGTPVYVTGPSLDILHQRSGEVRKAALSAQHRAD